MGRKCELTIVLLCAVVLVVAVGKLVANKQALAQLPPAVLRAIDEQFPRCWKSKVETIQDDGQYLLTLRQNGTTYQVRVRTSAEITSVEQIHNASSNENLGPSYSLAGSISRPAWAKSSVFGLR